MSARIRDGGWPPGRAAAGRLNIRFRKCAAIELAVGREDAAPNRSTLLRARAARRDHGARGLVGIDDRNTQFANRWATVLLPLAMPPVRPMRRRRVMGQCLSPDMRK
jgi:hypothetical protein